MRRQKQLNVVSWQRCERLLVILSAKRYKLFHDEVNKHNLGCEHIQLLLGTSTTTGLKFN
jgi:hypothetical protein